MGIFVGDYGSKQMNFCYKSIQYKRKDDKIQYKSQNFLRLWMSLIAISIKQTPITELVW